MTRTAAIRQLDALHARLPHIECRQKCGSCCESFRIPALEWSRIEEQSGPLSVLDRKVCPLLKDGACSVYEIRPTVCRLWYCVETNPCPHGCKPDRYLSAKEAESVMRKVMELSRGEYAGPEIEVLRLEQQVQMFFASVNVCP